MRRLLSLFISLCLILTQTAQAYSLARLPYKYPRNTSQGNTLQLLAAVNSSGSSHQETLTTDGMTV